METVVIVGAGPAGLSAGYQLLSQRQDVRVIIIEQDRQVGGISKTVEYRGNRMDLGGHRFFSKIKDVKEIWEQMMPVQGVPIRSDLEYRQKDMYPGTADPNTEDEVMLLRRRISRIYYNSCFFDYPVTVSLETLKKLGFIKSAQCAAGYLWSCVFKKKGNSLEDFYINRFGKPLYELFFKDYTTKLWGVSPAQLDSSWGAQRVKKLSLSKVIFDFIAKTFNKNYKTNDTSLIEEYHYPKLGPGQMWQTMAQKIRERGGQIRLETACEGIICDGKRIQAVQVKDAQEQIETIQCDYLLSSMPVKDLVAKLKTDVPESVMQTAQALPYRDFVTVGVLVDKVCLENKTDMKTLLDIPPDCWIYVQDQAVKMGRIQIFNNWSPFMLKDATSTVWLGLEYFCEEGDSFWSKTEEQISALAISELQEMGIIAKGNVLDSVVLRQKKAYPAYFGAYARFDEVKDYLMSFINLFCIGRNGQHRYNNMDHSMMTGILAAKCIVGQADPRDIWNVNTEQEYHEEGKQRD